jgi:DNA invertase Pin-like site-specific DNA recombinase
MAGSAATLRLAVKYAALYIRVSTADQGERYSPGSQKQKCLEKARVDGYQVRPEHVFIDKHTGKEAERPAFEKLRALVKTGAVQAVFALGIDRLARKVVDAAIVAAEFKRHGAVLDFVEMKNDDSPEGRFTFNMLASVAEYMGEKIVEKGRDGHRRMREEGRIPGRVPMFGHDKHPTEKGKRVINKVEQPILLKMFQMADAMTSTYAIAAWLNACGIRNKGRNGLDPVEWSHRTVQQVLVNRAAIGEHYDGGVLIEVPALVPVDLFNRVQVKLEKTRMRSVGARPTESLLVNFLYHSCGHRMVTRRTGTNGKYRSYICNHRTNKPPIKHLCTLERKQFPAQPVEELVWKLIWEMLTDHTILMSQAQAFMRSLPKPKSATSLAALERERATVRRAYANIIARCDKGHGSFADEKEKLDDLKRRIAQLDAEISAIQPVLEMPDETKLAAFLNEVYDAEAEPETFEERRDILDGLEDLEIVEDGGVLTITGKVPVGLPPAGVRNCDSSLGSTPNYIPIPFLLKGRVA